MYYSMLAGFLIGIGGIINLSIGAIGGAVFFSVGLLTILHFKLDLFTGKAGLLATNEITIKRLLGVWCGNFIGASVAGAAYVCTPAGLAASTKAMSIVATRLNNGDLANCILGVFCGILMYAAVTGYKETGNAVFVALPVAGFILGGFNHCIADMFYLAVGGVELSDWCILIPTTIGNIIGCNIIPLCCQTLRSPS